MVCEGYGGRVEKSVTVTVGEVKNQKPKGYIDLVTKRYTINGWALDKDTPNEPINIQVYFGGPEGTGDYVTTFTTNVLREDVNKIQGVTGVHGFDFAIPQDKYADGKSYSIYMYAIDSTDATKKVLLPLSSPTSNGGSFQISAM